MRLIPKYQKGKKQHNSDKVRALRVIINKSDGTFEDAYVMVSGKNDNATEYRVGKNGAVYVAVHQGSPDGPVSWVNWEENRRSVGNGTTYVPPMRDYSTLHNTGEGYKNSDNVRKEVKDDASVLSNNSASELYWGTPDSALRQKWFDMLSSNGSAHRIWYDNNGIPHEEFGEQGMSGYDPALGYLFDLYAADRSFKLAGNLANYLSSLRKVGKTNLPAIVLLTTHSPVINVPRETPVVKSVNGQIEIRPVDISNIRLPESTPVDISRNLTTLGTTAVEPSDVIDAYGNVDDVVELTLNNTLRGLRGSQSELFPYDGIPIGSSLNYSFGPDPRSMVVGVTDDGYPIITERRHLLDSGPGVTYIDSPMDPPIYDDAGNMVRPGYIYDEASADSERRFGWPHRGDDGYYQDGPSRIFTEDVAPPTLSQVIPLETYPTPNIPESVLLNPRGNTGSTVVESNVPNGTSQVAQNFMDDQFNELQDLLDEVGASDEYLEQIWLLVSDGRDINEIFEEVENIWGNAAPAQTSQGLDSTELEYLNDLLEDINVDPQYIDEIFLRLTDSRSLEAAVNRAEDLHQRVFSLHPRLRSQIVYELDENGQLNMTLPDELPRTTLRPTPDIPLEIVHDPSRIPTSRMSEENTTVVPDIAPEQGAVETAQLAYNNPYLINYSSNGAIDTENIAVDYPDGTTMIFPRGTDMEVSSSQPVFDPETGEWLGNYDITTGNYIPQQVYKTRRGLDMIPYKKADFIDESGKLRPEVRTYGLRGVDTGAHSASGRGLREFHTMNDRDKFLRLLETRSMSGKKAELHDIMIDNGFKPVRDSFGDIDYSLRPTFVPQSGIKVYTHSKDTSLDSTVTALSFLDMLFPGHEFLPLEPLGGDTVELNDYGITNRFADIEYFDDDFRDFVSRSGRRIDDDAFDNKYEVTGDNDYIFVKDKDNAGKVVARVKRKTILESVDNLNRAIHKFNRRFGTNYDDAYVAGDGKTVISPNIYGIGLRRYGGRLNKKRLIKRTR